MTRLRLVLTACGLVLIPAAATPSDSSPPLKKPAAPPPAVVCPPVPVCPPCVMYVLPAVCGGCSVPTVCPTPAGVYYPGPVRFGPTRR